jgi:hypothetical protein
MQSRGKIKQKGRVPPQMREGNAQLATRIKILPTKPKKDRKVGVKIRRLIAGIPGFRKATIDLMTTTGPWTRGERLSSAGIATISGLKPMTTGRCAIVGKVEIVFTYDLIFI